MEHAEFPSGYFKYAWDEDRVLVLLAFSEWFYARKHKKHVDMPTSFMRINGPTKVKKSLNKFFSQIPPDNLIKMLAWQEVMVTTPDSHDDHPVAYFTDFKRLHKHFIEVYLPDTPKENLPMVVGMAIGELFPEVLYNSSLLNDYNKKLGKDFLIQLKKTYIKKQSLYIKNETPMLLFDGFIKSIATTQPKCAIIIYVLFKLGRKLAVTQNIRQKDGSINYFPIAHLLTPLLLGIIDKEGAFLKNSTLQNGLAQIIAFLLAAHSEKALDESILSLLKFQTTSNMQTLMTTHSNKKRCCTLF